MSATLKPRRVPRRFIPIVAIAIAVTYILTGRTDHLRQAVHRTKIRPNAAGNHVVIVTAINNAFRSYLTNMLCSMRPHGYTSDNLLLLALDHHIHHFAKQRGYQSILLGGADAEEHIFGSRAFNLLSKRKLYAVYQVLRTGVDVMFVDADIVWCTDALTEVSHILYNYTNPPHLLMQTAWPRSLLNSGLYYARSTRETQQLFRAFLRHDGDTENDQVIVNRVLCRGDTGETIMNGRHAHPSAPHRLMPAGCRWDGRVEARLLDAARFPTGGEIVDGLKIFHHPRSYIMRMCAAGDVALLHNNCILSQKKKARFVVKGLWYVYADSCGGPAAATLQVRRACGASKCGMEGDLRQFPDLKV